MVQWLGHRAFKAKSLGSVLGQELRSQKSHGTNNKRQTNKHKHMEKVYRDFQFWG